MKKKFLVKCVILIIATVIMYPKSISAKNVQNELMVNDYLTVVVPESEEYLYPINIPTTGVITISGDFNSTSDGCIKILDKNGKVLIADDDYWADNTITGKKNLSMSIQVTTGTYYLDILNNYDSQKYEVSVNIKFTTITDITKQHKLNGHLNRNELIF